MPSSQTRHADVETDTGLLVASFGDYGPAAHHLLAVVGSSREQSAAPMSWLQFMDDLPLGSLRAVQFKTRRQTERNGARR
jgi:hypothetical protein